MLSNIITNTPKIPILLAAYFLFLRMKTLPCRTHKKTGLPCGNPVHASLYFPKRKELQTLLEVVLNTSGEPVVVAVLESGLFRKGLVISML